MAGAMRTFGSARGGGPGSSVRQRTPGRHQNSVYGAYAPFLTGPHRQSHLYREHSDSVTHMDDTTGGTLRNAPDGIASCGHFRGTPSRPSARPEKRKSAA